MSRRAAGVNIPVFSLRTQQGMGTGEFLDLIPFIDWANEAGLSIIQLLPINDISSDGSNLYPYSILSAFVLHPLYLNLDTIAPPEFEEELAEARQELKSPHLEFGKAYVMKMDFLQRIFEIRGESDFASDGYERFFEAQKEHLKPYAAFCALREKFDSKDFREWGRFSEYSELLVDEVCESLPVAFYYFIQFHLDKQFKMVVKYAKKKGIELKGDFSMGVDPNSVEAWRFYDYFRWDQSMGAPPDFYNAKGQNWRFPSYDWEEIKKEGYYWFSSRLKWMEQYFSIVRLDHVLGYFRLWEIPTEESSALLGIFHPSVGYRKEELLETDLKSGKQKEDRLFLKREEDTTYHPRIAVEETPSFKALDRENQKRVLALFNDYFLKRQEKIWHKSGKEKLSFIQKETQMFVCAEDIGVIPDCVEKVLSELNMLNLHVQRMPKNFEEDFEDPKDFPETCVCTPSNHDTATLREWWEEDKAKTALFYHTILLRSGEPPDQLTEELAQEIIAAHLHSKAQLAIFTLQDLLAMSEDLRFPHPEKERINDPGDPNYSWNWRMHLYVEELLLAKSFTKKIHSLIKEAKR